MMEPIISAQEGKLKGKLSLDHNGKEFYSFQGIPYAKPPLGNLRFKAPEFPEKWEGVRDATVEGNDCFSRNLLTNKICGSEDCLYLNVYTPEIYSKKLRPVMFWIHGGGFARGSGSAEFFGPEYLIVEDVVVITINYRLGVLGFLSAPDPSVGAPGNAGLKDTVMALKWVQKNIEFFSGDPNNVTIFGESAGGACVHYLVLSPMAKGLFHKAIAQSGSALNPYARGKSTFLKLAEVLGIQNNDQKYILNKLQQLSIEDLYRASQKIWDPFLVSDKRPFCPVIEPKSKEPGFLTEEPLEIMKSGNYNKVPMLMGYNSKEGIFIYVYVKKFKARDYLLSDATLVPHTMNLEKDSFKYKRVAEEIRRFYNITGDETHENDLEKAVEVYTHNFFMFDVYRSARLHCNNKEPLYFYRFNLDTDLNFMKLISEVDFKGAAHADDLAYLFKNSLLEEPTPNSLEDRLIRKITKLWGNFAKFGNPTPETDEAMETKWKSASLDKFYFLRMENDSFRIDTDPEKEVTEFWERLYQKESLSLSKL